MTLREFLFECASVLFVVGFLGFISLVTLAYTVPMADSQAVEAPQSADDDAFNEFWMDLGGDFSQKEAEALYDLCEKLRTSGSTVDLL